MVYPPSFKKYRENNYIQIINRLYRIVVFSSLDRNIITKIFLGHIKYSTTLDNSEINGLIFISYKTPYEMITDWNHSPNCFQ